MQGMILHPDEGERIRQHRALAELPELEAFELRFGPGFTVDPHTHADHADAAPHGTEHGFRTLTDVRLLNIHAPNTGFGVRLRED
jgi:hypothetical protein